MPDHISIDLDIEELLNPALFLPAAETEDELGCVLRFHLAVEKILSFYIQQRLNSGRENYVTMPRDYGAKLALAVAFGLPQPIAAVAKQIGNIRNPLAHGRASALDKGNVQQLGRLVNALTEIDEHHLTLERLTLELPVSRPDIVVNYGSGDLRLDFTLAAFAFLNTATKCVVKDAALLKLLEQRR